MRILDLALKDLQQIVREKQAALFLLVMPIAFTAFMGFAFNQGATSTDPRLSVGYIDEDNGSALSENFYALLEASTVVRPVKLEGDQLAQADARVQKNELAAVVVVPIGFHTRPADQLGLTLIADMNTTAAHTARNAVQSALIRLMGAARIAEIAPSGAEADRAAAITRAVQAWSDSPVTIAVEQATVLKAESSPASGFNQSSPGMIVQFAIMGLVTSASILVLERKTRTLARLLTTSLKRWQIIAGHALGMFGLVVFQVALLVIAGQVLFGVNYLREPLAVLIIVAALAMWVTALGLFISTLAKTEDQVVLFSLIAMFLFTALAGAWFPLEVTGPAFNTVGHLTPGAWAMDGLQNIVVRGLGVESALLPAAILAAYALGFFALAVWRFKFE